MQIISGECIKFLLCEFSKCIREGVLRHYFFHRFNLLSIKLTRAAKTELLQLLDIIVESDISIFKECATLQHIWSEFLYVHQIGDPGDVIIQVKRHNLKKRDYDGILACAKHLNEIFISLFIKTPLFLHPLYKLIDEILATYCKTPLKEIVPRQLLLMLNITILKKSSWFGK